MTVNRAKSVVDTGVIGELSMPLSPRVHIRERKTVIIGKMIADRLLKMISNISPVKSMDKGKNRLMSLSMIS